MTDATDFFLTETIAHARSLRLQQAVQFLTGLLQSGIREDVAERIRPIVISLSESDRQLELIQSGQLKLQLPSGDHS